MAAKESNMLPLGTEAPYFQLYDTIGKELISLNDLKSETATVITFICNHCPYVHHVMKKFVDIADKYKKQGISFAAISSNDVENYPLDHPDIMHILGKMSQFSFPYLYDEHQTVAKDYQAACTPDFFVFDKDMKLVYRGRFDESRPNSGKQSTGKDITDALDAIIEGGTINQKQYPSIGCSIKWKN